MRLFSVTRLNDFRLIFFGHKPIQARTAHTHTRTCTLSVLLLLFLLIIMCFLPSSSSSSPSIERRTI